MKELLEHYERKLKSINELIAKSDNEVNLSRLKIKASCYRSFIDELEYEIKKRANFDFGEHMDNWMGDNHKDSSQMLAMLVDLTNYI